MGFLAAYQTTGERAYLHAAEEAADWLVSIAEPARGGCAGPTASRLPPSIRRAIPRSTTGRWASPISCTGCMHSITTRGICAPPRQGCGGRRRVAHGADGHPARRCAPGRWDQYPCAASTREWEWAFPGSPTRSTCSRSARATRGFERYAAGAARYVESLINRRYNAVPEQPGQPGWDTGYLSGSAGDAFMFLSLYHHTRNKRWLRDAVRLLGFVDRSRPRRRRPGIVADRVRSVRPPEEQRDRAWHRGGKRRHRLGDAERLRGHRPRHLSHGRRAGRQLPGRSPDPDARRPGLRRGHRPGQHDLVPHQPGQRRRRDAASSCTTCRW